MSEPRVTNQMSACIGIFGQRQGLAAPRASSGLEDERAVWRRSGDGDTDGDGINNGGALPQSSPPAAMEKGLVVTITSLLAIAPAQPDMCKIAEVVPSVRNSAGDFGKVEKI
ncbi:conserved hypothetical protein [Histoplasma capsulatum H143]|uniref:Uncharacterized protein n=1 Tax=Ajellomyces capsulatus (strain H143) TaxID=544712 RepID=C6H6T8_AJECH|nr:conserved hypothetical protein [Histoplasma capsulatum H143]